MRMRISGALPRPDDDVGIATRPRPRGVQAFEAVLADREADVARVREQRPHLVDARALALEVLGLELDDEVRPCAVDQLLRPAQRSQLGALDVQLDELDALEVVARD